MASTPQSALLASAGARALGALAEDLARQWIGNTHACENVNAICDTIRGIVARAISNVVTEWNSRHDVLRILPAELQESCLGSLPVIDRCRLSLVCSHWRKNIFNLPGIWSCLELTDRTPAVDALLARSGHIPLDLTAETRSDPTPWDSALRSHSNRFRSLEVHINGDVNIALGFPAPHLEELTIIAEPYNAASISQALFNQHAPRLRVLSLTCISVPPVCPAFGSVTTLTLRRSRARLSQLFLVMPRLEILEILMRGYSVDIPELPSRSPLRVLRLVDTYITVEQLVELGYSSRVDVLDVTTTTINVSYFVDAIVHWPEIAAVLHVHANWEFEIVQRPGRCLMRFAVRPHNYWIFQGVFCDGTATFDPIERMVLPFSFGDAPYAPPAPILLARGHVVALQGLRTLALECRSLNPGDKVHPLRECILGQLKVPQLVRIEVLRADATARRAPIEPVGAADLVELVSTVLIRNNRSALELFIDSASGIVLKGDVDMLRNCIGRLHNVD